MSTVTDNNNLFNFATFTKLGQYAASTGTQDTSGAITAPTTAMVAFISYAPLTHGFNTYYKMQGFNSSTGKYEVWFSTNKPLLIPPSGNTLSNIEIVLSWIDR